MLRIHSTEQGSGSPVVLIHGFPMHSEVWSVFSKALSKDFKVYTPDLPGFGMSASLGTSFTIDDVAEALISWMQTLGLTNVVLLGHSLGGYVSLAVAEKRPDLLSALILFHSTANADNAEKKQSRNKVLDFIDKNGVETFTSNFIAPLFYNQNHVAIETVRAISKQSKADTVKGYTLAMRDRPDRKNVLKGFAKPILIIGGENDPGISAESLKEQATISNHVELHLLRKVAHMAMFEDAKTSLEIISAFIKKHRVTTSQ